MERLTEKQLHILRQKLCDMKNRCYNPQNKFYKDYGGRGITVCSEWLDKKNGHKNFREWALENGWKEGYSIDRINVNGNYEPSNCRWATPTEQANNRRNNNFVTINGVTKTTSEWAKQIGISQNAFAGRVRNGWNDDKLLDPKYKPLKMTKAEMSKEIRMYRNLEEQGLLLRLPCKVGDTIWDNDYGKPCAYTITGFSFGAGEDYIDEPVSLREVVCYYSNYSGSITGSFAVSEIGKNVFLTQAEAEKKLKEMNTADGIAE